MCVLGDKCYLFLKHHSQHYCIVLHCIALYYIVLQCITLSCIVLHCIALYYILSHALKNTANQRPGKLFLILRHRTGSIQQVVFLPAFPPLLASDYRNGAKTVCVRFRNGAKVVGQRGESFLHKVKIVLETWEVNTKLTKNSQIFRCSFKEWDKLVMQCFLMG